MGHKTMVSHKMRYKVTKTKTLYVTQFFMKFLKLAFIYKNYDTLRYVTFLYAKIQTLRKKQDNLRYIFIYKKPEYLRYAIFHGILKLAERGGGFYMQKNNALCVTFLYEKNNACLAKQSLHLLQV